MGCTGNDMKFLFAAHVRKSFLIHFDYGVVEFADDQQRGRHDFGQGFFAREIRTAATRYYCANAFTQFRPSGNTQLAVEDYFARTNFDIVSGGGCGLCTMTHISKPRSLEEAFIE